MSAGDYASAVAEFEPLISHTQKDIEVWLDYGIALLHIDRYSEAIAALESAQVLLRSDAEIQKEKKPDEIAYLKAQIYYYIGQIYYETGRFDAAIRTCQKAIQLSQNLVGKSGMHDVERLTFFSNVHANLAMVYEGADQLEQAIVQYQKALELLPEKPSLHRDLAGVYWKKRRYTAAEPHYKQVITHDATDVQAVYRLGLISLMKEDYLQAVSLFQKVIAIEATHVRAYGVLGVAYQELGNIPEAIGIFERVLELEPGNKVALDKLRELHESK
jgi:Flp pilus assembly protein TadD